MPNPKIVPFSIGRISFVDTRDVPATHIGILERLSSAGNERLIELAGLQRDIRQCGAPGPEFHRARQRWTERLVAEPLLSWEDFVAGGGMVETDFDFDPRMPYMLISVYLDGRPYGKLSLTHMVFESETRTKIEATARCHYLVGSTLPMTNLLEWGRVMRHLLDVDIELQGGQVLDIVEWTFPSVLPWIEGDSPDAIISRTVLSEVRRVGTDEQVNLEDSSVLRIRRSDAPRAIDPADQTTTRDPALPSRGGEIL